MLEDSLSLEINGFGSEGDDDSGHRYFPLCPCASIQEEFFLGREERLVGGILFCLFLFVLEEMDQDFKTFPVSSVRVTQVPSCVDGSGFN
jgi:hypothetical protein